MLRQLFRQLLQRLFIILINLVPVTAFASYHAPISVMGDHTHQQNGVMLSYRYMHMQMNDVQDGTDKLSRTDIFAQGYMITPLEMSMEMHMLGIMYAPSSSITLMLMAPYIKKEMWHITSPMKMMMMPANKRFQTVSEGVGDMSITALVNVFETKEHNHRLHLNLGLSLPTGSIDERDDTFTDNHIKLPYSMQLGSGTFDLKPGITYSGHTLSGPVYSWGAQLSGVIRLGENDNGYRLGNEIQLQTWLAKHWASWIDTSIRINGKWWDDIKGNDHDVKKMQHMVPTADTDNYGGKLIEAGLGINFHPKTGFGGNRLAIEMTKPIYQNLNGPQMANDWSITAGWQLAF